MSTATSTMLYFQLFLIFSICFSWSYCKNKVEDYCRICKDHTMCKYQGIGSACEEVGEGGVNEADKRHIVNLHNHFRSLVAAGKEKRGITGPQPKAANMLQMKWDDDLAEVAQKWADQCTFEHDKCRKDPRWAVGQNVFWNWKYPTNTVNWTEAIQSWYDEVALYDNQGISKFVFNSKIGHYTQMVWANTYTVGCGRRDYGNNKIYVCNYGPAGNWLRQKMYVIGEPCTKCPSGSACEGVLCATSSSPGSSSGGQETLKPNKPASAPKPKPNKPVKPGTDSNFNDVLKPNRPHSTNTIHLTKEQLIELLESNQNVPAGPNAFGGTEAEKREIMNINHFRSYAVAAKEKRGKGGHSQPKSSNTLKLYWNNKLAEVAQKWSLQF